ncbi:MAG: zinc-binding alcohol dehydrogenase family protein [Terracidiphilus sp.]|nr:zinc-binding alcohol dehydrogenase family protein [Terracidiphilus sp.]
MHAAVVVDFSKPPVYQTFSDPTPQEGEVLIKVAAAGLHPIVKALAKGAHYSAGSELPVVPGIDGVGTTPDGERVYFMAARRPWGAMGEFTVAVKERCVPLPEGLDTAQAAAVANPGMSAWLSLKERAGLRPGETVVILGATGVAGHLAIQSARRLGAGRIVAAGRNVQSLAGENVDAVIGLGEEEGAVREAMAREAAAGIDVVIDYLWGRPTELLLEALAKGFNAAATRQTRWVEVGSSAGTTITLPGATLRSVDLRLLGSGFGSVPLEGIYAAIPQLFAMATEGALRLDVETVPLAEVEQAWTRTEKAQRLVLTV